MSSVIGRLSRKVGVATKPCRKAPMTNSLPSTPPPGARSEAPHLLTASLNSKDQEGDKLVHMNIYRKLPVGENES